MEVGRGLGVLCAAAANCDCGVHGAVGDPDYEYIFGHQIMTVEEDIFRHARKTFRAPLSCGAAARGAVLRGGAHEKETTPRFPQRILKKAARSGTTTAASAAAE